MESLEAKPEQHQLIEVAAYYLWQQRGSPFGSPEVDWFEAEEQMRVQTEDHSEQPTLIAAAKTVGSALGAVAGFVASLGE